MGSPLLVCSCPLGKNINYFSLKYNKNFSFKNLSYCPFWAIYASWDDTITPYHSIKSNKALVKKIKWYSFLGHIHLLGRHNQSLSLNKNQQMFIEKYQGINPFGPYLTLGPTQSLLLIQEKTNKDLILKFSKVFPLLDHIGNLGRHNYVIFWLTLFFQN